MLERILDFHPSKKSLGSWLMPDDGSFEHGSDWHVVIKE